MRRHVHASLVRSVEPAEEPVTLTEAKSNMRVDISADDAEINRMIAEAREDLEDATARAFVTQTWVLTLDRFPCLGHSDLYRPNSREIELRICPVQSVTSITYLDTLGASQTLSTDIYTVDIKSEPGRISLRYGQTWPVTLVQNNAVTITFVAGYGDAEDVPNLAKRAIKMRAAHFYNYRGIATDPKAKAGESAWESLKQMIGWGSYP